MDEYLARICWNSKCWTEPTGEAAKSESGSYAARSRLGHEEWLFDPGAIIDGWQYGFLQPVSKSRDRLAGETIDVRLFTISPQSQWFYVGRLPSCEVLTVEAAESARVAFRKSGRLKAMDAQVRRLKADPESLLYKDPRWLVNVRFRPEEAERHDPLVPVKPGDSILKLPRYVLVSLRDDRTTIRSEWPTANRVAAFVQPTVYPDDLPPGITYVEGAAKTVTVNAFERNDAARAACLRHYGSICCVCGFTPEKVYGPGFEGLIHVHHLTMISAAGGARTIDPVKDLRPVCPNCHAALHRKNPPHTPDELKRLLRAVT